MALLGCLTAEVLIGHRFKIMKMSRPEQFPAEGINYVVNQRDGYLKRGGDYS
jgi:hypothetical protein